MITDHLDQTFVWIAGQWMYLFRAVYRWPDGGFLYIGTARPGSGQALPEGRLWPTATIGRRKCSRVMDCGATPRRFASYSMKGRWGGIDITRTRAYCNNRIESDDRHIKRKYSGITEHNP